MQTGMNLGWRFLGVVPFLTLLVGILWKYECDGGIIEMAYIRAKGCRKNMKMSKSSNIRSLILPFIIGIALGIIAKFTDGREFLYYFPLFADVMGRFGIWVWAAALIAIRSKKPGL